ncbi:MAG: choice-of-anchor C family protein [Acidobacteriota bacterium]|nr:choice-of-anchor C family protein [Acidobacteriota bacterium]
MRTLLFVLASLLLISAFAQQKDAKPENLVANGGFDQGADPGGFKTFKKGDKFPGWTITKGSIDQIGSYFKCAHGRCLDMNGNELGAIRQTLATEAGKKYEVSFLLSVNPQCGGPKKALRVSAAGDAKSFVVMAKANTPWAKRTWEFTAKEDKTPLSFESIGESSACGPLLDSVTVTLAPDEPATTPQAPPK